MFLSFVVTHDHLQLSGQFTRLIIVLFFTFLFVVQRSGVDPEEIALHVFHKRAVTMTTYMLVFRFKTTPASGPNRELLLRITIEIIVINIVVSTAVFNNPHFSLYLIFNI
jgi:hypothetical protein